MNHENFKCLKEIILKGHRLRLIVLSRKYYNIRFQRSGICKRVIKQIEKSNIKATNVLSLPDKLSDNNLNFLLLMFRRNE